MARAAFRRPGQAPAIPLARMGLALSHPLRAGLRFYIVCQGGMAVDLVTGAKATVSGALAERTMVDGRMADFDGSDYFNFPDNDTWDITGDITLFWRGIVDSDGTFFLVGKNTNDVGANSPFYFSTLAANGLDFVRTDAAGNFSFWRAACGTTVNAPVSYGVTCPAVSNVSCTVYRNGVPSSAALQFSAGTATPTGNSQPLRLGRDIATTPKQLDGGISVTMGWARQLNTAQHVSVHRDPYQLIVDRKSRRTFVFVSAGSIIAAGLAIETDSAFGITWSKRRAVGLAAETDSALAAVARRVRAVGQPAETDSAFAVARAKLRAVGLAAETDSAPAATPRRTRAVGLPNETDAALAVARRKTMAAGLATETDTAPSVSSGTGHPIGQATETDTAFAVTRIKLRLVGLATETDTPLAIVVLKRRAIGLATETDAAPAAAHVRGRTVGLAVETDTAPAVGRGKSKAVGLAVETDSVLAFVIVSDVPAREQVLAAIAAELATITGIAGLTVARARTTDVLETELPILVLFDDDERLSFEMTGERKAVLTIRVEGFASGATALAAQQAAGTLRAALDRLLADPDVMFSPSGKTIRALRQLPEGRPARLRLAGGDPAAAFVRRIDVEYATPIADPYTLI